MPQSTAAAPGMDPIATADPFAAHLEANGHAPLTRGRVTTLQLNIGLRCNLACHHCHVESGPKRSEAMDFAGAERVLALLERNPGITCLDLTGGAPEMNEHFRSLVAGARHLDRRVIDRCNLTIFFEPGHADLPEFLADQRVDVVASLPCYTAETVDRQRGRGVFAKSIDALVRLNELGYGGGDSGCRLDLVYNPPGASLPASQPQLEARYRDELRRLFGVEFDALLTITNMPIKRFAHQLRREGRMSEYMSLLVNHFNRHTLPRLMCRNLVSVGHDGRLYDCDFNHALDISLANEDTTIWDLDDLSTLEGHPVATGTHCFGCTAGAGSSCGGALS